MSTREEIVLVNWGTEARTARRAREGDSRPKTPVTRCVASGSSASSSITTCCSESFKKKDDDKGPPDDPGNPTVDFHGEKRTNDTHESTTDPDAKLARKGTGKEAKLSYSAHALIENRNGLVLDLQMDVADGRAERRNALKMLDNNVPGQRRITVAGDKGYDTSDFVEDCRERNITPHVAQNITKHRGS